MSDNTDVLVKVTTSGDDKSDLYKDLQALVAEHGQHKVETMLQTVDLNKLEHIEPILDPKNKRYTAFPIKYPTVWQSYQEQKACNWTAEEIDFSKDYEDYIKLTKDEQHFIDMILAFFAASDGIVNFNLSERFTREIQIMEGLFAYQYQIAMENVHSHVYSLMLDNIVKDPQKKLHLFNAIETVPAVKEMADWAFKWIDSAESFAHRLIAFAIVEAVFFSGAFAAIFWLKKHRNSGRMFMNGLISSNKLIARDEGLHCKFACTLYSLLEKRLDSSVVNQMMSEGVDIAKNFITKAIPVKLIGMNSDLMNAYEEYIADRLLNMLGYKKMYNTKNPFLFMETIGLNDKTNFFESRPTEYQDAHVMNSVGFNADIDKDKLGDMDF